jgi:hypothetical protein
MGQNLKAVVCAAGIAVAGTCLVGCHKETTTTTKTVYGEGGTITAATGLTGSSASPYTREKPVGHTYTNTPMPYQTSPYYYNPNQPSPTNTYNTSPYNTNPYTYPSNTSKP